MICSYPGAALSAQVACEPPGNIMLQVDASEEDGVGMRLEPLGVAGSGNVLSVGLRSSEVLLLSIFITFICSENSCDPGIDLTWTLVYGWAMSINCGALCLSDLTPSSSCVSADIGIPLFLRCE